MVAKRIPVDKWRTIAWATYIVTITGLSPERLQQELYTARFPSRVPNTTNLFRKYLTGHRSAAVSIEGDEARSYVMAGEAVCRGSYARFAHPLFNLLEELFFLERPDIAQRRFLTRIAAEFRVGLRLFEGLSGDERLRPEEISDRQMKNLLRPYRDRNRLQRIRVHLLNMPAHFRKSLFRVQHESCRLVRRLQPLREEESLMTSPPSIDDLGLALAFCLEALELDDYERYWDARGLLSEHLSVLRTEGGLAPSAVAIEDLMAEKLLRPELASYDYIGSAMSKTISKALWPLRHLPSDDVEMRAKIYEHFDRTLQTLPELIRLAASNDEAKC